MDKDGEDQHLSSSTNYSTFETNTRKSSRRGGGTDNQDDTEQSALIDPENDPDLEGLSLYEKKALLVNKELDRQGMGKYQWCVFLLCGFGYLLDLMWAQALGLVISPMQQEFGFTEQQYGNIFSAFSAGLTVGAFVWGFLVDILGRYWAFNFTVLWASVFGLVLGVPNTYTGVVILAACIGVGVGGNIPVDTTICLECLPQNRKWLLPALSVFQPIGVIVCSLICYGFVPSYSCKADLKACSLVAPGEPCCTKADNYGWRYVMFTLGVITACVFIARYFCFSFQESPKYLLYRGKDKKAAQSLQNIAKFNGRDSIVTRKTFSILDDKAASESDDDSSPDRSSLGSNDKQLKKTWKEKASLEADRYKMLFSSRGMTRLTLLLWAIYAFDYWGFQIAGSFLPTILKEKGEQLGLSLEDTYRSYVFIYLFGVPGVLVGATVYGWRQLSMFVSSALFGATLFVFTLVHSQASYIGINGLVYFFQSMFNGILYGATPEFYPAPIRGTAAGVCSTWGRVFSIIAPIAASQMLALSLNGVLYMAGSGVFVCTIAIVFLPKKYVNAKNY